MLSTFDRLPISRKMLVLLMGSGVMLSGAVGAGNYLSAASSMTKEAEGSLMGIAESRREAMTDYLSAVASDLKLIATNPFTADALRDLSQGFKELGPDATKKLQLLYIEENPNPTGQKEELDLAPDGSFYSRAHGNYHPWFRQFLRERGYYDIFLFSADGQNVYSVFKELDFSTNLLSGQWRDTDLGHVFRDGVELKPGEFAFEDFAPYAPSNDVPAGFVSTPIVDGAGETVGVLAFQMPIGGLNHVMHSTAGLGETGQAFMVGDDGLMRTDAPRAKESTILVGRVPTSALVSSGDTQSRVTVATGADGNEVISAAAPMEFAGVHWNAVAQRDKAEALAGLEALRTQSILISLVVLGLTSVLGIWLARRISKPVQALASATHEIAEGNMSTVVPGVDRKDELGPLAAAIEKFRDEILKGQRLAEQNRQQTEANAAQARANAEQAEAKSRRLTQLVDDFRLVMRKALGEVGDAARRLGEDSGSMAAIVTETANQSGAVVHASKLAASNVQNVAAASEELSASVNEIMKRIQNASENTRTAVSRSDQIHQRVTGLEAATNSIGQVVELINSIAAQTNLLALNATIEAARAGDAGRGFAVVASEVKQLAGQTAKATDEIQQQVAGIQSVTSETVNGIRDIVKLIRDLETASVEIASAVSQQASATREISASVQSASSSVSEVDSNIAGVSEAADEGGRAAERVRLMGDTVARTSVELRTEIERFLSAVQAA